MCFKPSRQCCGTAALPQPRLAATLTPPQRPYPWQARVRNFWIEKFSLIGFGRKIFVRKKNRPNNFGRENYRPNKFRPKNFRPKKNRAEIFVRRFFSKFYASVGTILRWEMDLGLNNFSTNYFGCSSKFA